MEYKDLLLEKDGEIAVITLNVPEKMNALTVDMRQSIVLAVDNVAKDDEVRVVIVTGAGRGFCSGADVTRQAAAIAGQATVASRDERYQVVGWPVADIFPSLNKPVIAAVNGAAVGAGFSVALSCDIRIASETAKFGAAQLARGLVPDAGLTYYLPEAVGMSKAAEIMFTGAVVSAAEAEKLGLVSRVVPPAELMPAAKEIARKVVQQAPIPIALTKKMLWRGRMDSLVRQIDLETSSQIICRASEDHKESVRAFLGKLPPPKFKGK